MLFSQKKKKVKLNYAGIHIGLHAKSGGLFVWEHSQE